MKLAIKKSFKASHFVQNSEPFKNGVMMKNASPLQGKSLHVLQNFWNLSLSFSVILNRYDF